MQRRRTAVYIITGACLLAGVATGRRFFYSVTYAFIGLLALSYGWAWIGANWLTFRRYAQTQQAQVGEYLTEYFQLTNTTFIPKLWLEIYDQSTLPGHASSHIVGSLDGKQATQWRVNTMCTRRGRFRLGPLSLIAGDPFGLFQVKRELSETDSLIVRPQVIDLTSFRLPAGSLTGGKVVQKRTYQVTTNAAGVRDYVPGDGFNRIHWKSSARKGRLIVKEFELDPLSDVWIILDADHTVHAGTVAGYEAWRSPDVPAIPPSTEEYMVTVAASLSYTLLQQDRSVGLLIHSAHRVSLQPDRGVRQQSKILDLLAVLETVGRNPLDQVLVAEGQMMSRGTTVLLITPSTRTTWPTVAHGLTLRGLNIIVIAIDAQSFGGRPGHSDVISLCSGAGFPTYPIKRNDDIRMILGQPVF